MSVFFLFVFFKQVLEKWKNLEKSKSSTTTTNALSTPDTPKLHRRCRSNVRRFSESDSAAEETPEQQTNRTETLRRGNSVRVRRSRVKEVSAPADTKVDQTDSLESIQQFTSEIEKLSQNVIHHDENNNNNNNSMIDNSDVIKRASPKTSPRELRSSGRRSRSPNAIIVRRKSIKSITPPPPPQAEGGLQTSNIPTIERSDDNKKTINTIPAKYQNSSDNSSQQNNRARIQQRTTADGKPIGYATKILGSPTLRHTGGSNGGARLLEDPGVNIGSIIDDSPEKIKSDLDSYIEQSFRDIETTMRRRRRRPESGGEATPAEPRKRERRGYKNREKQSEPVDDNIDDDKNDDVFTTTNEEDLPERKAYVPIKERTRTPIKERTTTPPTKLETIKSQEEVILRGDPNENKTTVERKNSDNTMDTMREFEEFLRKQERKTNKEIKRLSRESLDGKTSSQENISRPTEEVTLEQYKKKQAKLRRERKEFQEKHLKERRSSLGSKWPSLGNIFFTNGKPLERKLSLPSNLERPNYASLRGRGSSIATNSSTESLEDQQGTLDENNNSINKGRQSAPLTNNLNRSHSFSGLTHKQRANSTGHSPDVLICDIEEEIISSGDEEGTTFKSQQLDSFNSNLDQAKSLSEESLNRSMSLPRRGSKGFMCRTFRENQIGLQHQRKQRMDKSRVSKRFLQASAMVLKVAYSIKNLEK